MERKKEFDAWGFGSYIVEYRLKIRMTEDIIDAAQRLEVKPDNKTQQELDVLKKLRDRTYEDLKYFIEEREKKPWRVWDKYGYNYKPAVDNYGMSAKQAEERIDAHLLMISYLEPKYRALVNDIPPYNSVNSEMIGFCTQMFGNEGWLQMF